MVRQKAGRTAKARSKNTGKKVKKAVEDVHKALRRYLTTSMALATVYGTGKHVVKIKKLASSIHERSERMTKKFKRW